ncbi:archaetidylserine decarboxylase [Sulfuriflexus sp.]|uniref:archaetidylserine decarboxylase n=1 Tax=Sulfuriflexus sp. TaxID=2015443 RepID=UPI0028CE31FD|nr:archaetidylserine decarboxylase [Sulfuriflexus sp.]MDT8405493.1 archaetidylserine decarboxylase [Sulfuriflexus sp.]
MMKSLLARLISLLPAHAISRFTYRLTRIRTPWFKNVLIRLFVHHFRVAMDEAVEPEPTAYKDFNSFFTRALRHDVRPLATEPDAILSPVDGQISQLGGIEEQQIFQAKKHSYSLTSLLGGSATLAEYFIDGKFCTIYLSPRDYHRIHMPLAGDLREMVYVPGKLFSVNQMTVAFVPSLFARNERVINIFDTELGPMAMVLVGAINVGSIETSWHGCITPPYGEEIVTWRYDANTVEFKAGDEMGRFNMGSTVILLFTKDVMAWQAKEQADSFVKMGRLLGTANR